MSGIKKSIFFGKGGNRIETYFIDSAKLILAHSMKKNLQEELGIPGNKILKGMTFNELSSLKDIYSSLESEKREIKNVIVVTFCSRGKFFVLHKVRGEWKIQVADYLPEGAEFALVEV